MKKKTKAKGRPCKKPQDRRTSRMELPLTAAEKRAIVKAAESVNAKPVSWAREVLMAAAEKR